MVLKRIEIFGFKSFPDRTVIDFPDGITAIVGANGCGKSNVSDAIRWVLGEQSAKSLRGDAMEDLIFSGTATRKPMHVAEVILTFDNTHKLFPLEFTEVSIGRRLFRNGDSSYLLNKQECRLRDVFDLLMDSGIGRRAHTIIEQGKIDEIVMARPEEKRRLIEEAAGIAKYRSRRAEALRRLEATREGLRRVDDLVLELERQEQSLRRQSRKAERHRELSEKLRTVELGYARARAVELSAQVKEAADQTIALDASITTMDAELAETALAIADVKERLELMRRELREAGQALGEAEKAFSAAESRLEEMRARQDDDARSFASVGREIDALSARLSEAEASQTAARGEAQALEEALAALVSRQAEAGVTRDEARSALVVARARIEELRAAGRILDEAQARLTSEDAYLERSMAQLAQRESALRTQRDQAVLDRQKLEAEVEAQRAALEAAVTSAQSVAGSRRDNEMSATLASNQADAAAAAVYACEVELAVMTSRLDAATSRAAAEAEVVQEAATATGVNLTPLGDALTMAPDQAAAVAAALGDILHGVLVTGFPATGFLATGSQSATGVELDLDAVARRLAGRTVVGEAAARYATAWTPSASLVALRDVLTGEIPAAVRSLLAGWYYAADDDVAVSQTTLLAEYERIVTAAGAVHYPFGARRVACVEGRAELGVGRAALALEREELSRTHAERKNALASARGVLDEARRRLKDALAADERARDAVRRVEASLASLEPRLERHPESALETELERVAEQKNENAARRVEITAEMTGAKEARQAHELHLTAAVAAVRECESVEERARTGLSALDVEVGRNRERVTGLKAEAVRLAAWIDESVAARNRYVVMQGEIATRQERLADGISDVQKEVTALAVQLDERRRVFRERETACVDLECEAGGLEESQKAGARVRESSIADRHAAEMRQVSLLGELEVIRDRMREKYGVEDLEATATESATLSATDSAESAPAFTADSGRVDELKEALSRLGGVNFEAQHELVDIVGRLDFYRTQRADLSRAETGLTEVVGDIDQRTLAIFEETFRSVNANFGLLFNRMFGARGDVQGSAELVMLDPSNPLESGIDIIAMPPGKKSQTLSLLSGGEKALTAVALLFAVFLVRPSPFAVLDELDAPLDEANVGKYVQILKEFSQRTQFIIITHNKRTMESANTLYGVTQPEKGISTIIGVRMSDHAVATPVPAEARVSAEGMIETEAEFLDVIEDEAIPEAAG